LEDLRATISAIDVDITATITDGTLNITTSNNHSFSFSDDTSNVLAALGSNNFFEGDGALSIAVNPNIQANKNLIAAGKLDSVGNMATGDNTNALDIANLEYQGVTVKRWTYIRGLSPTSIDVNNTLIEDYLHALIGEVGIESQSIKREMQYKETLLDQISELRNNISAVSLDEEMTQLIKFQQAYTAAAKLVTTVDEMFQTLLSTR
jgi:flagellar hook-associated protein 1 FlgK